MKKLSIIICLLALFVLCLPVHATTPTHRLAVRPSISGPELYDTATGYSVVLRGNTYIHRDGAGKVIGFLDSDYGHAATATVLDTMQAYGYNTVRVIVYANDSVTETGINQEYLDNVVDFLTLADARGLHVWLVVAGQPTHGVYWPAETSADFEMPNQKYLDPALFPLRMAYITDMVNAIVGAGAPVAGVIWQVANEIYFDTNKKPFTLTGTVEALDGQSYDMLNSASRLAMMDSNQAVWINAARAAVRSVLPDALVTANVFGPTIPPIYGKPANYISRPLALTASEIDLLDIHIYPGTVASVDAELAAYGTIDKPTVLGEFGAYPFLYPTIQAGIDAAKGLQVKTCGRSFRGWLYYDYDDMTYAIWHATDSNNAMLDALSLRARPDPCALAKPATLSGIVGVSSTGVVTAYVTDPDNPNPPVLNAWENGVFRGTFSAMFERPDLAQLYPWTVGRMVGRQWRPALSLLTDGQTHVVCVYFRDYNDYTLTTYTDPLIGCVTLPKL